VITPRADRAEGCCPPRMHPQARRAAGSDRLSRYAGILRLSQEVDAGQRLDLCLAHTWLAVEGEAVERPMPRQTRLRETISQAAFAARRGFLGARVSRIVWLRGVEGEEVAANHWHGGHRCAGTCSAASVADAHAGKPSPKRQIAAPPNQH
jgi:hypothetical protein